DRLAPATFSVNSFLDTDAVNLVTGQDQTGNITLRSAIEAANSQMGASRINLAQGTYSLVSHFLDGSAPGALADLSIVGNPTIVVAGSNLTSIDGGGLGRVLQIANTATVTMFGVWIANGLAADNGGGLTNAGNLTLNSDVLYFNRAVAGPGLDARGGSVFNAV